MRQFLIWLLHSGEAWDFMPAPQHQRGHLQAIKLLSYSLELATQHQGAPASMLHVIRLLLFHCCPVGQGVQGPSTTAVLAFAVSLSNSLNLCGFLISL